MQKDPNSYRLLLVEDNPGDLFLIRDYLDEEIVSPEILEAGSYKAALETLEQQSQLDVILLDLSLPDKNGEELLRDMLAHSRGTPIIVLTGYTDMRFAVKSLSMGVSDYLLKDSLSSAMLHKSILYSLERNRYLLQIRNSEQRYSDLFHLSPQPMWVYDMQSLHFLDVNEAAVKQYGYSKEEFLKMTIKDIRPSEDLPKLEAALDKSRPHERYYFQGEFRHQKKNGELLIVDVRSNIIYYGERKAELVLATDISERYKYIKAIEEQNKKLREIAWTQSHVVRAPLARIMGLTHLFEEDTTSDIEKHQLVKQILESAGELDDIIRDIVKKSQQIKIDQT